MSNCTNQTNTAGQASSAGLDLDKLDKELDSILSSLSRDYKGSVRDSISTIRAMVEAARKPAETAISLAANPEVNDQVGAAGAETASSALHACITYVVHGDADFSGMDAALVSYFKEKVRTSRTHPSSLQVILARGAWKLVPVKLTEDMLVAFAEAWYSKKRCIDDCEMDDAYAAMLAVAPMPRFFLDARPGFTAVADRLVNDMRLYFDANANVSDECADFLERLSKARAADTLNTPVQPEDGWQGLPPIGERESIMDVCGLPALMRGILESKGSPDSLGKLYDFIDVWGDARFEFGQRTAGKTVRALPAAHHPIVADYLAQGWSFEYEPETRYIGLNHPRGGKQSICEIQNEDKFGYAIAALLNCPVHPTAEDVQPSDTWRVGEFWSSGSPGTKVLMLSRGTEIASHEKHESFIRWVGASGIHARSSKTAG